MATYYPPVGFHFRVEIEDRSLTDGDIPFIHAQEVKGLSVSINFKEVLEGGENTFAHRLPEPIKYDKLTIVRGMVHGSLFTEWILNAVNHFIFDPKNITVILLDEEHQPLESWYFVNAVPSKITISDFSAQDGKLVTETLEFSYQYFKRGDRNSVVSAIAAKANQQLNNILPRRF
ncbi:MAG: phage tail protein [Bacteroidia bacterium]